MNITLQYFDGCPSWKEADATVRSVVADLGIEAALDHQPVDTPEEAERLGFRGSPTVLLDGKDPFAEPDAPVGLACRIYHGESGPTGSPDPRELERAIVAHLDARHAGDGSS